MLHTDSVEKKQTRIGLFTGEGELEQNPSVEKGEQIIRLSQTRWNGSCTERESLTDSYLCFRLGGGRRFHKAGE